MLLVAFEPEDESPIVFLRLRKAVTKGSTKVLRGGAVGQPRSDQAQCHGLRGRPGPGDPGADRQPRGPCASRVL
ncbi:MAG: hypothetical protein V9G10_09540 [Candidatus Nanopelagicales bacterium]